MKANLSYAQPGLVLQHRVHDWPRAHRLYAQIHGIRYPEELLETARDIWSNDLHHVTLPRSSPNHQVPLLAPRADKATVGGQVDQVLV